MKRIICLLLSAVFAFSLTACGNTESEKSNNADKSQTSSAAQNTQNGKKTLVVYFSATGSTRSVAEKIADITGADIFEVVPKKPYSDDDLNWSDDNSRVSREHDNESLRNVELDTATPDNFEQYDTVYIGYPIWWGIAAWPINGFVKTNNFADKTVIPFCTSASSGLGDSAKLLAELSNGGNWKTGERFSSGASAEEISKWVDKTANTQ